MSNVRSALDAAVSRHPTFGTRIMPPTVDTAPLQVARGGRVVVTEHDNEDAFEASLAKRFHPSDDTALAIHFLRSEDGIGRLALATPPYVSDVDGLLLLLTEKEPHEDLSYWHFSEWCRGQVIAGTTEVSHDSSVDLLTSPNSARRLMRAVRRIETSAPAALKGTVTTIACLAPYLQAADDGTVQVSLSVDGRLFDEFAAVAGPFRCRVPLRIPHAALQSVDRTGQVVMEAIAAYEEAAQLGALGAHGAPRCLVACIEFGRLAHPFTDADISVRLPEIAQIGVTLLAGPDATSVLVETDLAGVDENAAGRLAGAIATALGTAATGTDAPLAEIAGQQPPDFAPPRFSERNLIDLYADAVSRFAHRTAVIAEGTATRFAELDGHVTALAAALVERGTVGDRVLILADRSLDAIVAMFGVLRAGMVCVPILPDSPDHRVADIARLASATHAVAQLDSIERANRVMPGKVLPALGHPPNLAPSVAPAPTDTAYLLFTSGTTGTPKGVAVAHHSVANLVDALDATIYARTKAPLRISLNAPLAFDASMKQLFQLTRGRTLVVVPQSVRRDPEALAAFVHTEQLNVLDATPTILDAMIEHGFGTSAEGLPERILIGGEPISQSLWDTVASWASCEAWNVYGPTEATVNTLVARIGEKGYVNLGAPLPNMSIAVVDEHGYEVPAGAVGELLISGAGVAQGYIGASAAESAKFIKAPSGGRAYRSGDLVRRLADDSLAFVGRNDDQVKIGGQRLELGEIRHRLEQHPLVQRAAIVLDDRDEGAPRIVAAVTSAGAHAPDDGTLYVDLPNGLRVASVNANETHYQYKEIFEDKIYTDPQLPYPSGAVVFDVGANIGMFTIFVAQHVPEARIYAFEPLTPIRERLARNVAAYAPKTTILPCALASKQGETEFTYYPGYSMMSGRSQDADAGAEMSVIETFLSNSAVKGDENASILRENLDELLQGRFDGETHICELRRLSDVIDELGIERIDLLKIDVQRAELDVLYGIEPRHFSIIRSVALEIHDDPDGSTSGRVQVISELLKDRGFEVRVTQDELLRGTDRWNCVAVRRDGSYSCADAANFSQSLPAATTADSASLHQFLAAHLPAYMLPSPIIVLDDLPMTPQGKLDHTALFARIDAVEAAKARSSRASCGIPNQPEQEIASATASTARKRQTLLQIWRRVLRKPDLRETDNFFHNGGDSIRAIMMQSQARKAGISINLAALNATPTVAGLLAKDEPASADHSAPRHAMLELWRKVLRNPEFDESDNFYLKGGDSIRAIMLQSQARKAGFPFSLKTLNEHPVFTDFCAAVLRSRPPQSEVNIHKLAPTTDGTAWTPSSLQQAMLLATLTRGDARIYHNATVTPVRAPFDAERFSEAVAAMRRAHPVLAARVLIGEAGLTLVFDHRLVYRPVQVEDLSALDEAEADRIVTDAVFRERDRHFAPTEGDLVRFSVFIRAPSRFDVIVAEHHAALDGMSLNAMIAELVHRYQGRSFAPTSDIAVFEALAQNIAETSTSQASATFWRSAFASRPEPEPEPLTVPRGPNDIADMRQVDVCVSYEANAALAAASQQLGASRKALLFALHARALNRLRGPISSLGVVTSLRPEVYGSENAVGMFLNVLPVPVEGTEIAEIAVAFDHFDQKAFAHKAVSQERLREWVGAHALIDSIFNFIQFPEPDAAAGDVYESERRYFAVDAYVPLAIDWDMSGGRLAVGFQYDHNRLDDDFAEALATAIRAEVAGLPSAAHGAGNRIHNILRDFGLEPSDRQQALSAAGLGSLDRLRLAGALKAVARRRLDVVTFMSLRTVGEVLDAIGGARGELRVKLVELSATLAHPHARIIGFPQAGAAASAFDPWCELVSPEVAVHALQAPDPATLASASFETLVTAIAEAVEALTDVPCIFVGSSFGAILAFETALRLTRRPTALFVVGSPAPTLEFEAPTYHLMDDAAIDALLRKMRMATDALPEEALLRAGREALRAMSRLAQSYSPTGAPLVDCNIVSVWPRGDRLVTAEHMQGWQTLAGSEYTAVTVSGGHAVLVEDPERLYAECGIASLVERLLSRTSPA
ncbi:non-ribosomal peptide synthetase [Alkalilimnicola ehrlichii]|uniref:non-ribosomal peptide synthetase n=1 Tax=Alkalilimnicola ehrlichii TaxID=351052 RepID=UPI0011C017C7|nr:non-ribosomal peptide synthetase [Alkalilimnicola ehrlichii]